MATAVILDCYTVEPSGLGVPPYLSTYVRQAFRALTATHPAENVRYVSIDDVRWCIEERDDQPGAVAVTSARTYSTTSNRDEAVQLLATADVVVVIAGDKVPSVHLHGACQVSCVNG